MAKFIILIIFAMSKTKDKVINQMRGFAVCKPNESNISAVLALAEVAEYLYDSDDVYLYNDFIQIICRPRNFNLSYEQLAYVCHYNEKTIRSHCKRYSDLFSHKIKRLQFLPLPLIVARLIEYVAMRYSTIKIPALRNLKNEDILRLIAAYPCPDIEKEVSYILFDFYNNYFPGVAV